MPKLTFVPYADNADGFLEACKQLAKCYNELPHN